MIILNDKLLYFNVLKILHKPLTGQKYLKNIVWVYHKIFKKTIIMSIYCSSPRTKGGVRLRTEGLTSHCFAAQLMNHVLRFTGRTFLWQAQPLFLHQGRIHSPLCPKGRAFNPVGFKKGGKLNTFALKLLISFPIMYS